MYSLSNNRQNKVMCLKFMTESDFRHPMNQVSNTAALVPISCSCASSYGRDSGTGRGGKRAPPPPLWVEMGFYADISWESRCPIEINV